MSTEEEEEDEDEDEEANEERARIEGDIDKVEIEFHCSISVKRSLIDLLISNNISCWPCADISWNVQVVQLVHELKAADIEEYRKKIVERDKNKDEDVAEERRAEREAEKVRGERSKFDGKEKSEEGEERLKRESEKNNDQSDLQRVPSPAAVFTFDQEDIQTSKLLSFERVNIRRSNNPNMATSKPLTSKCFPTGPYCILMNPK